MNPQERIELLQAQLAARESQLASQSVELADLRSQKTTLETSLAERTQERDDARAQAAALRPPTGSVIPRAEFKRRFAPAFLVIATKGAAVQNRWDRILSHMLSDFTEVRLTEPVVRQMVATAVADGLLTQAEADAVLAVTP